MIIIVILLYLGFKAYMLSSVSAEDCLFADLAIDTSFPCLQLLKLLTYYLISIKTSSH